MHTHTHTHTQAYPLTSCPSTDRRTLSRGCSRPGRRRSRQSDRRAAFHRASPTWRYPDNKARRDSRGRSAHQGCPEQWTASSRPWRRPSPWRTRSRPWFPSFCAHETCPTVGWRKSRRWRRWRQGSRPPVTRTPLCCWGSSRLLLWRRAQETDMG